MNVHFFRGIQKSFPRTRKTTTTTNKPSLRPRQRSLAVKNSFSESSKFVPIFAIVLLTPYLLKTNRFINLQNTRWSFDVFTGLKCYFLTMFARCQLANQFKSIFCLLFFPFPELVERLPTHEILNLRVNFTDFCLNGLLLLFSRLIHEFLNSRCFSAGTN